MNLLFVSDHDICRGPLCRAMADRQAIEFGMVGFRFSSAGISVIQPERPPTECLSVARSLELDIGNHRSRPLSTGLLQECDAAICMTTEIAASVRRSYPAALANKAVTLTRAADMGDAYDDFVLASDTPNGWTQLTSTLRAAVGTLIRRLDATPLSPIALGVGAPLDTGPKPPPSHLTRNAAAVYRILQEAEAPLTPTRIAAMMSAAGTPLEPSQVAMLFLSELRRYARQEDGKGWALVHGRPAHAKKNHHHRPAPRAAKTGPVPMDAATLRPFIARFVLEMIERSFGEVRADDLLEALKGTGQPVTGEILLEILRDDLKQRVEYRPNGTWRMKEISRSKPRHQAAAGDAGPSAGNGAAPPPGQAAAESTADVETLDEALTILGMSMDTPFNDAQKTYRNLMSRYHPDKFHDDPVFLKMAESKSRRINQAWELVRPALETRK